MEDKQRKGPGSFKYLDIHNPSGLDLNKEMIKLSLSYQVLSNATAFVSVYKESDDVTNQTLKEKVIMHDMLAIDYNEGVSSFGRKQPPKQTATLDDSILMELIKSQHSKGYWTISDKILKLLNISNQDLDQGIPNTLAVSSDNRVEVWLTLVILASLQEFYAEKKKSWSLIETKALHWLDSEKIPYAQFRVQAKSLLIKHKNDTI